jgi:hypothetical protein
MTYLIKGIPVTLRLVLFFLIEAGGMAVQLAVGQGFLPGTAVMIAGLFLVVAKSYNNKPRDLGYEDWKPASTAEFQRIKTNLEGSKKMRLPFYFRKGAIIFLIAAAALLFFLFLVIGLAYRKGYIFIGVFDTLIVAAPLFSTGLVKIWTPADLAMKVRTFSAIIDEDPGTGIVITPYLRLDRDAEGRQIPEDVRFMVELKRNPDDFVGIQMQIAVNSGPKGKVPYMYAVFLCRGSGVSFQKISKMDFGAFIMEPGGDEEYGTIVIRQKTGGTGYHTTPSDCRRLYLTVTSKLAHI